MSTGKMRFVIASFLMIAGCWVGFAENHERPNFIFILTDDQSYGMMGCDGNERVQTPHLDSLAAQSVFFDYAHITSAICTPSRISILLSQYERKHGVNFNSGTAVSEEAWNDAYPLVMRRNGYYTGYVGKNHAPIGEGGYESGVMDRSFDYWYAGHGHIRFYPKDVHEIFEGAEYDTQPEIINEAVQDFLSNEHRLEGALTFLDQRPNDQPFCLSVCFNLPHGAGVSTMQMRESDDNIYKTMYRDQPVELQDNYIAKKDIKSPKLPADVLRAEERQTGYNYVDNPEDCKERTVRQMQAMTGIDRMIGHLLEKLRQEGLDKNTILVFSSDHGLFMGQHGLGGKALCYEVTTHVPMMFYIPPALGGPKPFRSRAMVQSIDIAPTILDYAEIDRPEAFQGKSLKGILSGKPQEIRDWVFTENLWATHFGNPPCQAIQNHEWKYIRYYNNPSVPASQKVQVAKDLGMKVNQMLYAVHDVEIAKYRRYVDGPIAGEVPIYEELYHIATDPTESNNIIHDTKHEAVLAELREAWLKMIKLARGEGAPKVVRYTKDSQLESTGRVTTH